MKPIRFQSIPVSARAALCGLALAITASLPDSAVAQVPATPAAPANPVSRAAWLDHLTLGAGDVLNLSLFGSPELSQTDVSVGPDGRVGFLEAQDVMAAGLTLDEFRAALDTELGKYRRAARTIVTPVTFRSKKYFVLGQVSGRGVFTMDRPVTVIEAVARARGVETRGAPGRMAEVADLSRSFLARDGRMVAVDFERLFSSGDLTQNAMIEPGDYLYFAPARESSLYVLGEVNRAGTAPFMPNMSAVAAVAAGGGFTERAWTRRILVVRGSLEQPETFVIDMGDILAGKAADIRLQPRDIVYVSSRPWIKAEDLLDAAAGAFVQAAVIVWTGDKVYNTVR